MSAVKSAGGHTGDRSGSGAEADSQLVDWDPTVLSPLDQEVHEREVAARDRQRRSLYEIREKLQRAMIAGDRFNCVEQHEEPAQYEPYIPATHTTHRVLTDSTVPANEMLYATNAATSLMLSRQFEGISRKDIVIQESDERLALMQAIHAIVQLQMQRDFYVVQRRARELVEKAESREAEMRAVVATRLGELEASCRRRTETAAEECFALIARDGARALQLASVGHSTAQRNWLEQEEERSRWSIVVDAERGLSRIYNLELSRGHELRSREMLDRKVPLAPTALIDADAPASTRLGHHGHPDGTSAGAARGTGSHRSGSAGTGSAGDAFRPRAPVYDIAESDLAKEDLVPSAPAPQGMAESETSSAYATMDNPNSFRPYWGWMLKSTGVLMTWQRRFFVFTTRGKLKCAPSDNGPWTVLLTANNIMRVEVDSYHDANGGVAPPTSQYHQYGFYVDAFDPQNPQRPRRLRFCCFCRKELNAWLTVLRRATDVIFALEEAGAIARSPARRRLDMSDEKTRLAIRNLNSAYAASSPPRGNDADEDRGAPPTYRRRVQLEEDLEALELRDRQLRARGAEREQQQRDPYHEVPYIAAHLNSPSPAFGRPPGPSPYLEGDYRSSP